MIYTAVLSLHIAGAIATAIVGFWALYAVWYMTSGSYRQLALSLGVLAAFETASGTLLSILSAEITAAHVCQQVILYLSLVGIVECLLFARLKRDAAAMPIIQIAGPVSASVGMLFLALVRGF